MEARFGGRGVLMVDPGDWKYAESNSYRSFTTDSKTMVKGVLQRRTKTTRVVPRQKQLVNLQCSFRNGLQRKILMLNNCLFAYRKIRSSRGRELATEDSRVKYSE